MALLAAACAAIFAAAVPLAPAQAQAIRTWVSGVGDDFNPCSRTAPCKTFAGAISKTAAGGEISVLDPGGFGAVTITKSISIVAAGAEGSIIGSLTTGILINAAPTDTVNIYGLFIEGGGTGINGIRVLSASRVTVKNCVIRGFQSTAAGQGNAVLVDPSTAGVHVVMSNCLIAKNVGGVLVKPSAAGRAAVHVDNVMIDSNTSFGLSVDGRFGRINMSNSQVLNNFTGLSAINGGTITSYGNNVIFGNARGETPTNTLPLQ
jgi:hypothetical protein